MFLTIIDDVIKCLEADAYIAALTLALTIPDICGKAEYGKEGKKRYIEWYDEYIGKYESNKKANDDIPELNGETVYQLRCYMLHQGTPNIYDQNTKKKSFILEYEDTTNIVFNNWTSTASFINNGDNCELINSTLTVNLNNLCVKLCKVGEDYYKDNKEKFDFFDYKMKKIRKKELTEEERKEILENMIKALKHK